MIVGSLRLVLLHHRYGLGSKRGAQAFQFQNKMRHVGDGILEDQRLQVLLVGKRIVDRQPAAPGMTQHVDLAESQRLANRLGLLDVARDSPERGVRRPIGGAGAKLVERHDPVSLVYQAGVRFAKVVAGQARPAVEAEHRLAAGAEAVGDDLKAVDIYLDAIVGRHFTPHDTLRMHSF